MISHAFSVFSPLSVAVNPQALEPRALSGDQRGSSFDLAIRIAIPSIKDDEVDDMSGFHLPGITVPAQKHQYINRSPPALSAKLIKKKAAQYSQNTSVPTSASASACSSTPPTRPRAS